MVRIIAGAAWLALLVLAAFPVATEAPLAAGQTTQTKQVMRLKLAHAEQLLGALVTSNWEALGRHGRALEEVTRQPGWDAMRLPEFRAHTGAFSRATQGLVDAADARDQRIALVAYSGLIGSCVECHRYVARARIARVK